VVSRGTLTGWLAAAPVALLAAGLLAACGSSSSSSTSSASSSTASSASTNATNSSGASSGAASSAQCDRNKAVGKITYISPFGYDAAAGLMDVFVAQHLGYFKDLCLDVSINASAQNGQQLVSSGRAQFTSIGSAADDLLAKANGANLTAISTDGAQDPHAIYTQAKITNLKQLEGGTLGYHINVTPAADAMLVAAGADPKKVKFISLTSFDPTVVTRGQIDGAIGFASNEPNELKLAHQKFNEFLPSQYGVGGTYTVMQVNTSWYNKNRAVAADWMRADLKALQYCITNQAVCVKYMTGLAAANGLGKAFPPDLESKVWATESTYVLKNNGLPPGVQTYSEWQPSVTLVTKYGGAKNVPPLSQVLDPTLVASLYKGSTLIWPGS
jgi:ABC-type nitrate/sulfonate/bicarbonate transport system substrate-binding protein